VWEALAGAGEGGEGDHPVSTTLARNYFAWCLAQWGHTLGHGAQARALDEASRGWQGLFDLSMGFFRPKNSDGTWTEGFSPLAWKAAFAEGSAWQGGWSVPHDPEGLIAALGGPEVAVARLDTLLALKPLYSSLGEEAQGMTQMALSDFGQYVHSLPSAHAALWHYALVGRPDKTERLTRRVVDELYASGVEGFCGPEAVALASWYLWACLGLYPLCPGAPDYVLGSPVFDRAQVHSGDGKTLVIEARGRGHTVRGRTLGSLTLYQPRVAHSDLFEAGLLVCQREDYRGE
jgi:predicted alpha-1,2-mannosidase